MSEDNTVLIDGNPHLNRTSSHPDSIDNDKKDGSSPPLPPSPPTLPKAVSTDSPPFNLLKSFNDNPFRSSTPLNLYEITKLVLMTLLGVPFLRIAISLLPFFLCWLFAVFATVGSDPRKPFGPVRLFFVACMKRCIRFTLLLWGFWIRVKRKPGPDSHKARAFVSNHVTLFDAGFALDTHWCVAAKEEALEIPITGRMIKALQGVPIDRVSENGRQKSLEAVTARIKDPSYPPLLVYPQGTTCNPNWLTTFKRGVFWAGEPIQPLVFRFKSKHFDLAWNYDTNGLLYVWRIFCQFYTIVEVEYLDVYFPNEHEKKDPFLFASNVRQVYARHLNAHTTEHCFDDVRLRIESWKKHIVKYNFYYRDMQALTQVSFEGFEELIQRFHQVDVNGDGLISYEEFASILTLDKNSEHCKRIFQVFDVDHNGTLDFGEFIIGFCLVHGRCSQAQAIQLCFQICDRDGDGYVDKAEFTRLMNFVFPQTARSPEQYTYQQSMIDELFPHGEARVTMEHFTEFMHHHAALILQVLPRAISIST